MVKLAGKEARLDPDAGKPLVYIDYLESAPWNLATIVDAPLYGGRPRRASPMQSGDVTEARCPSARESQLLGAVLAPNQVSQPSPGVMVSVNAWPVARRG